MNVEDGSHVRKLILGWEKNRKNAKPKRKTGLGGVPVNTDGTPMMLESENLLLEIFSNNSLPEGDTVHFNTITIYFIDKKMIHTLLLCTL